MKKKTTAKLSLQKTTLHHLNRASQEQVKGGITGSICLQTRRLQCLSPLCVPTLNCTTITII
jgi:hypothetical protein